MSNGDLIQVKRGASSRWQELNPVLALGEPGYDYDNEILKIGNGVDPWVDLPSVARPRPEDVNAVVEAYFVLNPVVDETELVEAVYSHVSDPSPHPAYDDIQSLVGLFENGLV